MSKGIELTHVNESALRILAELGYQDDYLRRVFGVAHGTIWGRRKRWGIESGVKVKIGLAAGAGDLPIPPGSNPPNQAPAASSSDEQLGGL